MALKKNFIPQLDDITTDIPALPNTLLPFIWFFVRQMKLPFMLILVMCLLSSVIDVLPPLFIKLAVDAFARVESPSLIWEELGVVAMVFFVLVIVGQPLAAQIGRYYEVLTMPIFINRIRRQLALYMNQHSFSYFQNDFAGRLASKVVETPDAIGNIVSDTLNALIYGLSVLIITLIMFMIADPWLAVVGAVWLALYAAILVHYIPKIIDKSTRTHDDKSIVRGRYVDTLSNILNVKLFARWRHEDEYLSHALKTVIGSAHALGKLVNRKNMYHEVLSVALIFFVFLICILRWQSGHMSAGDVAMALPAAMRLMHTSWWQAYVLTNVFQNIGQIKEGMSVITRAHSVTDTENATDLKVQGGAIEFRNVDFKYGTKPLFENFNLSIPAGQKVGLIGHSGAGKSTLAQITLRLFDIQGGQILVDGQDIMTLRQDSVRQNISIIPQTSELLHRSVMENIRYGRLDASDADVMDAARRAYAHDFIMDLEDHQGNRGYAARVGERGVKLSGGQRQRVAIARAILKQSPILLLDEATSALDSESEHYIQSALKDIMSDKTVIAIAHRLSTIAHLDRLIVMDNGKIIEDGTHQELLAKGGLYTRLWTMQSGGFLK